MALPVQLVIRIQPIVGIHVLVLALMQVQA